MNETDTRTSAGGERERPEADGTDGEAEQVRVWLVERTYSDDEQNLIISTYATPDGERYYRQERALTTFSGSDTGTPVSRRVPRSNLGRADVEERERFAAEAARMAEKHAPDDRL
jgi:hypothetical protein